MEKFSLEARARVLMKSAATAPAGRAAETVYGGHEHVLRQTLIALTAGSALSEHENPGEATLQLLGGRVRLGLDRPAHRRRASVAVGRRRSSRYAVPGPQAPRASSPRDGTIASPWLDLLDGSNPTLDDVVGARRIQRLVGDTATRSAGPAPGAPGDRWPASARGQSAGP